MQTWAKRGIQTALVTGGLLMLGTGIASADENVNPDSPAGPLDLNVNVPVQIDKNAVGTPLGQINTPGFEGEISTDPVTKPLKEAARSTSVAGEVAKVAPVSEPRTTQGGVSGGSFEQSEDAFKGNKIDGDLTVPIQICGNAIGVIGDASVEDADCVQSYENHEDTTTDGAHSGLAGNAVVLDWALPVQIAGNAGGLAGGSGYASGTASQDVSETGNITTDGTGSGASGNVVAGQFATPVQVTGNAASWILANAYSDYDAETEADSGGWIKTDGEGGSASGNVVGAPIALPVKLNGNAAGAWGSDADSVSSSSAEAEASNEGTPGINGIPSYIQTDGDKSFLSGNIAQPQGALVANVAGNAASWIGNATTGNALGDGAAGTSSSEVEAGGFSSTSGQHSGASGNIVDAPIGLPAEVFGVGGTYIGNSHAAHDVVTDATAGDGTYTNGDGSGLGGNSVHAPLSLAPEVFGIGGSHIGNASGTASEEKTVTTGGYNGTRGNDSTIGGNLVQVPAAIPVEVFGIGGSYIGQGKGIASETKRIKAGGPGNTVDDDALGSSNLVATPLSVPVQLFGIGASHIGRGVGVASSDTITEAGGDLNASGKEAGASGNIATVPVALPAQLHGLGGSFIGTGHGTSTNLTDSIAGGDASTDGQEGAVSGNVIQAPVAGAANVFGSAASWIGLVGGESTNDIVAVAGGDTETNGDGGGLAGNVISAQALPIAQVFGDAAALMAKASGEATNTTDITSGGDIETSGVEGGFSGNILDVPAAAVAQVFGNAVAVLGVADAEGHNVTMGTVGGETTTGPEDLPAVSGIDGQLPIGALVQIYDVPFALLGAATAEATNLTDISVAGQEPQINLPIDGAELPADSLPTLPSLRSLPSVDSLPLGGSAARSDVPSLPEVNTLPVELLPANLVPQADLGSLPSVDPAGLAPKADVPAMAQLDSGPLNMVQKLLGGLSRNNGVNIQG
ncbi:hypothetical protein SAMN05216266_101543 [Amycolatopsis marina]|uniref:Small secreted domain n=1 Tax=Amycolatopsis marina TaxID=490629 RepID=A0A1I0VWJ9_9PSEU|nr:PE-PGRS family protein [Amycolatopsis marina]SFA80568.1 hypothetical protein SAMN05216266_101543 [Amycolatopsis marina]